MLPCGFTVKGSEVGYALSRIAAGSKPRWLLVKMRDEKVEPRRDLTKVETKSALSGRTMKEIREEEEARITGT